MEMLSGRNIVLTGVPRGGTTLACQLLGACSDTVALFEPMNVNKLPTQDPDRAVTEIAEFFNFARARALQDGVVPSKQVDGRLPDNLFANERDDLGRRPMLARPGFLSLDPRPNPGFTLVVKHNAAFTALLPALTARFETLAIVRHPLAILSSWHSVDLPVSHGRLPAAERLDPSLADALDAEPRLLSRQLIVLDWFYSRFDRLLPEAAVLRYEDIIASQGELLRSSARLKGASGTQMIERNANPAYGSVIVERATASLLEKGGYWQRWYPKDGLAVAAARIIDAQNLP